MKALKKYLAGTLFAMLFACVFIGIKAEAAAPGRVTGVKQIDASSESIEVQWNYQEGNDLRYEVWVSTAEAGRYVRYDYAFDNTMYVNRRNSGKTYYVKVRAYSHVYDYKTYKYVDTYGKFSAPVKMVTAPAAKTTRLYQSAATTQSITLKWNAVAGATGYNIYYRPSAATDWKKITVEENTKKISGLSKNTEYDFKVHAIRRDGGYTAEANTYESCYGIPTLPTVVGGVNVGSYYHSSERVWMEWNEKNSADGYYYQLYYGDKKMASGHTTNTYVIVNAKQNRFYKFRVKGYINVNGKKKYGAYSSWYYFAQQPEVKEIKVGTSGIFIDWDKVNGATNYSVYVSPKTNTGYKKVATTTKTSYKITKYGKSAIKSGKTYYVYVVANKKVGSKTYKSAVQYYYSKR